MAFTCTFCNRELTRGQQLNDAEFLYNDTVTATFYCNDCGTEHSLTAKIESIDEADD